MNTIALEIIIFCAVPVCAICWMVWQQVQNELKSTRAGKEPKPWSMTGKYFRYNWKDRLGRPLAQIHWNGQSYLVDFKLVENEDTDNKRRDVMLPDGTRLRITGWFKSWPIRPSGIRKIRWLTRRSFIVARPESDFICQ